MNLLVKGQKSSEAKAHPSDWRFLHGAGSFAKVLGSYTHSAPCFAVFGETVIVTCW